MLEEKVVALSKVKIVIALLGIIVFVALGAWLLSLDAESIEGQRRFSNVTFVHGLGVVSIVFFGLCGVLGVRKLLDRSPGLILSKEGILDNSSGISLERIPWSEVTGISEYQIQRQKFISIQLKDPEKYINKANALKRMTHRANMKMCGTPMNISANSLKMSYDELRDTIIEYYHNSFDNT
ncbi:MAG: STM3941 family protein [Pseudomonadota bacterium]